MLSRNLEHAELKSDDLIQSLHAGVLSDFRLFDYLLWLLSSMAGDAEPPAPGSHSNFGLLNVKFLNLSPQFTDAHDNSMAVNFTLALQYVDV